MSIFSKLFGKKQEENAEGSVRVGGMEDFMTLIRVYYQAVMASQLGISNINLLPDMAVFKRTLKVPTQNNKLGIAEKSRCRKMLMDIYGLSEGFFQRNRCFGKETLQDGERREELFLHVSGLQPRPDDGGRQPDAMEIPYAGLYEENVAQSMTDKTIHDILTKTTWKDDSIRKTCANIRQYQHALSYSEAWMSEYVYNIVALAKKRAET